jgi:pyruvate,orthophosphate dikinase
LSPQVGVAGRHTGDVASIAFFERIGVEYLCCAPQHVPVAKVAAAQARILNEMRKWGDQSSALPHL